MYRVYHQMSLDGVRPGTTVEVMLVTNLLIPCADSLFRGLWRAHHLLLH